MGLDFKAVKFIEHVHKKIKPMNKIVTIGRQEIDRALLPIHYQKDYPKDNSETGYCEKLLVGELGASVVDSIDFSDYEGATILHDMNKPLPKRYHGRYDTVIDGGSLEHIYHITQALENCALLCRQGGQILHFSPGNNFCNHGYYQFSPDLFHQLYCKENGYRETEVFLSEVSWPGRVYRIAPPQEKRRELNSRGRILLMVRTTVFRRKKVRIYFQQADYQARWLKKALPTSKWKLKMRQMSWIYKIAQRYCQWARARSSQISPRNKNLKLVRF